MSLGLLGGIVGLGAGLAGAGERQRQLRGTSRMRDGDINFLQSSLKDRIEGYNPLVDMQQRQMLSQAQAGANSMAAGARPGMGGAARRQAAQMQGNMASGAVGQGILAKLLDRQNALRQYGDLTTTLRGQDLQLAGLQQQVPTGMEQLQGGLMGLGGALMS